ncbi:hypothetical protein [Serratia liquefaciens]|uniref:hypothetical protein n=1 Tax=Serratia liquefaciens TaxID=614 RepID=UPI0021B10464|nr:hypothetical protein [Serratia liquefaciens]
MISRLVGVFLIGAAVGGWFVTVSAGEEAERRAEFRDELRGLIQGVSSESAQLLETKLQELHGNEIHTERVIHTETIKPVFRNVCATDEYVRLFNHSVDQAERTLSGKPDSKVPGKPAAPGGANGK